MKKFGISILAFTSFIYLLNPTAGIFELIPDNIPFVGNIDEGFAAFILYSCIEYLSGKKIGLFSKSSINI